MARAPLSARTEEKTVLLKMIKKLITAQSLAAKGVSVSVPLISKLFDFFKEEEEMLVEWTGPDYVKVEVLFGLLSVEKGERQTFRIRGKPGFVAAVINNLQSNGRIESKLHISLPALEEL
jgi:hypothetical protein